MPAISETLGTHLQPQTLRIRLKPDPSTAASGTLFVRARARARTNKDGYSILVNSRTLGTRRQGDLQSPFLLPSRHLLPDTLPHLVRVHKDVRTLTGCARLCSHGQESSLNRNSDDVTTLSEH